MPTGVAIPREDWEMARKAIENGEKYEDVSARVGIKLSTLRQRSGVEKWRSPARRVKAKERVTGDERVSPVLTENSDSSEKAEISGFESLGPHRESLLVAANEGPEAFREALKQAARSALANSASEIPLPRTIGEWKQMVDVLDKAEKMGGPQGESRSIRPVPVLSRSAPIEAELVPEQDGFAI